MDCVVCKAPGMCVCPSGWYNWTLSQIVRRQMKWSRKTFGEGKRTKGVIAHIKKELAEIENAPLDLEEWVDVMILAIEGAWRTGAHPDEITAALHRKTEKNANRKWPDWRERGEDEAIEHIKE